MRLTFRAVWMDLQMSRGRVCSDFARCGHGGLGVFAPVTVNPEIHQDTPFAVRRRYGCIMRRRPSTTLRAVPLPVPGRILLGLGNLFGVAA